MWFSEAFGNIDFGPATVARVCRLVSQFRWTFYSHATGHSRPGPAPFGFAERGGHQRRILFLSDPLSLFLVVPGDFISPHLLGNSSGPSVGESKS